MTKVEIIQRGDHVFPTGVVRRAGGDLEPLPVDGPQEPNRGNKCCDNGNFGDGHECQKGEPLPENRQAELRADWEIAARLLLRRLEARSRVEIFTPGSLAPELLRRSEELLREGVAIAATLKRPLPESQEISADLVERCAKALSRSKGHDPNMPVAWVDQQVIQRCWELDVEGAKAVLRASGYTDLVAALEELISDVLSANRPSQAKINRIRALLAAARHE